MNTFHRYLTIATFALATSAFADTAAIAAGSDAVTPIQPVSYKDLDLSRESGASTLYKRIEAAAQGVCAPLNGRRLIEQMNQSACVTSSIERAVKQVNEPMLTRYYLARNPKADLGTSVAAKR